MRAEYLAFTLANLGRRKARSSMILTWVELHVVKAVLVGTPSQLVPKQFWEPKCADSIIYSHHLNNLGLRRYLPLSTRRLLPPETTVLVAEIVELVFVGCGDTVDIVVVGITSLEALSFVV